MTDADRFLAAILAAPADDLPRLVFADWLDEHGDPDRAEFIRGQVRLARGPHDPALAARTDELLAAHRDEWVIPGIRGGQFFRRGFVEALQMAAGEFVAHADRIGRAAPVVDLRLPMATDHLPDIAAVGWLSRLEVLDLRANVGIGGQLADFFAALSLPRLRTMVLQNAALWPDDVDTVATAAARLPALEALNLSGNYLGDEGAARLAGAASLARLRELTLRCDMVQYTDSIHAAGAAELANSPHLRQLRVLDLADHYVGDAGINSLVLSENARHLELLDVSYNEIGTTGDSWADAVTLSPFLPNLKGLNLAGNRIGRLAADAMAGWPHLATGCAVDLRECDLPDAAYDRLLASPYAAQFLLDPRTFVV